MKHKQVYRLLVLFALALALVSCSTATPSSNEEKVDSNSLKDGGYVVLTNNRVGNATLQSGGVYANYIAQSSNDINVEMFENPTELQSKINEAIENLLSFEPTNTCEVFTNEQDESAIPNETLKDVGESVTLSSAQDSIVIPKRIDSEEPSYFALLPEDKTTFAPLYNVVLAGRDGLSTQGYRGQIETIPFPEFYSPAGIVSSNPVQIDKSKPLELRWQPTGSRGMYFQVSDDVGGVACVLFDTGQFTLSQEITNQIPGQGDFFMGPFSNQYSNLEDRRVRHSYQSLQINTFIAN
jgi:hypothetical protein